MLRRPPRPSPLPLGGRCVRLGVRRADKRKHYGHRSGASNRIVHPRFTRRRGHPCRSGSLSWLCVIPCSRGCDLALRVASRRGDKKCGRVPRRAIRGAVHPRRALFRGCSPPVGARPAPHRTASHRRRTPPPAPVGADEGVQKVVTAISRRGGPSPRSCGRAAGAGGHRGAGTARRSLRSADRSRSSRRSPRDRPRRPRVGRRPWSRRSPRR